MDSNDQKVLDANFYALHQTLIKLLGVLEEVRDGINATNTVLEDVCCNRRKVSTKEYK
jgi:hypothetical protein